MVLIKLFKIYLFNIKMAKKHYKIFKIKNNLKLKRMIKKYKITNFKIKSETVTF